MDTFDLKEIKGVGQSLYVLIFFLFLMLAEDIVFYMSVAIIIFIIDSSYSPNFTMNVDVVYNTTLSMKFSKV